jgi:hypothetical protein
MENQVDFGTIDQPTPTLNFGALDDGALGTLLQLALNVLIVIAGIYALFNFILAGYAFLSAGDDPKQIQSAWAKIYQSIIGLVFAAGSLVLAAIFGQLIFNDPLFIIKPSIPFPN